MAVFDNFKNFIRQGKAAKNSHAVKHDTNAGAKSNAEAKKQQEQHSHKHESRETREYSAEPVYHAPSAEQEPDFSEEPVQQHASSSASTTTTHREKRTKQQKYDDAIKQIIAEEKQSHSQMPSYPGLEQYELVEKMGDGAFSVVYRAIDRETGEPRAIKAVKKKHLTSSQRASVLKEAAIMRQLDHPSIVHMFSFIETPVHYFIVLELVPGGELFHQIVHLTYFSEDLSRHVILQVAHAVRYLHEEAGVVHRDIKPENLLFTPVPIEPSVHKVLRPGDDASKEDEGVFHPGVGGGGVGTIKLADFGLSKVIWDSKTMTPCGTVGYTAPEIVKDERYSKSVDMWALGCVLYTILCGFPPFYDESIETLTHKVAMGQYTFLSPWWDSISDGAKDLVSRLLTVDPEKRYTIDEFLQHPWITQTAESRLPSNSEVSRHLAAADSLPDTPLQERGGVRSGALKDAFDVSNAVYRLEQEMSRRNQAEPRSAIIMEEEEDDELSPAEFSHIENAVDRLSLDSTTDSHRTDNHRSDPQRRGARNPSPGYGSSRAAARRAAATKATAPDSFFDLHLEGSTLLERRKARQTPVAH